MGPPMKKKMILSSLLVHCQRYIYRQFIVMHSNCNNFIVSVSDIVECVDSLIHLDLVMILFLFSLFLVSSSVL